MFTLEEKETDAADVLRMVLNGKISGRISEWPQLKPAISSVLDLLENSETSLGVMHAQYKQASSDLDGAQREIAAYKRGIAYARNMHKELHSAAWFAALDCVEREVTLAMQPPNTMAANT